jgi:hypothetical protein
MTSLKYLNLIKILEKKTSTCNPKAIGNVIAWPNTLFEN